MAILEEVQAREAMAKSPKIDKKNSKRVLIISQELKLARVLSGNNKTARDRALKGLKQWFQNRSSTMSFTEEDFLRLWKGLFYSMWMSDKPLIQEECAENIAHLVHSLPPDSALLFYKCGLNTLMNEWFGIDQLRLDKFLMLARRMLRQVLFVLKNENWAAAPVHKFAQGLSTTILNPKGPKPVGLLMHFVEIYLEELAKVSKGEAHVKTVTKLLAPFINYLAFCDDSRIIGHIRNHVFTQLIRQSDLGLEYEDKYNTWKRMGFPGSIDQLQKIATYDLEDDDDEDGAKIQEEEVEKDEVFDPRAGRVDVELPQIKFSAKMLVKALSAIRFVKGTNAKSRKCISDLIECYKKMLVGVYPFGVKRVKLVENGGGDTSIRKAVNRLNKFEHKIMGKTNKNKKRKHTEEEEETTIKLRGGKKVKITDDFRDKLSNDFIDSNKQGKAVKIHDRDFEDSEINFTSPQDKKVIKKKRKLVPSNTSDSKRAKIHESRAIESIFRRNSGTWLVTKLDDSSSIMSPVKEAVETTSEPVKKRASIVFTPQQDSSNSTPAKKVQINTSLNRSQEVREHHAQILSSPAIPYDANKKPAKPLLKTPIVKSPINPFYKNIYDFI